MTAQQTYRDGAAMEALKSHPGPTPLAVAAYPTLLYPGTAFAACCEPRKRALMLSVRELTGRKHNPITLGRGGRQAVS
eukprot:1139978-Pelagomonas_calceolata.AAC.2